MKPSIKIGTRASKLALWQANWVQSALNEKFPDQKVELVTIKTKGDKILDVPLAKVGGKGLFVKEIEQALLEGRIDLAVHSMKDMPAEIPDGLCIGAIPQREDPSDVLVAREDLDFSSLKRGAVIGTSSLRRAAQLRHARPDISITPLRGNLDTRLKKLQAENLDAIVLAAAGIKRLNLTHRITEYLQADIMLPAVGQGALCIERRQDDHAGHGEILADTFSLTGLVAGMDGSRIIKADLSGPADSAEAIGVKLAEQLLARGADEILKALSADSKLS